jgi:hypothetical protein
VGDVQSLRAELALLAASFVLPGVGPDVDQAIGLACELLVCQLDTRATVNVAALRYATPLRDAGSLLREMLQEPGFPAPHPDAGETEEFRAVLRALAAGSLAVGEFYPNWITRPSPTPVARARLTHPYSSAQIAYRISVSTEMCASDRYHPSNRCCQESFSSSLPPFGDSRREFLFLTFLGSAIPGVGQYRRAGPQFRPAYPGHRNRG